MRGDLQHTTQLLERPCVIQFSRCEPPSECAGLLPVLRTASIFKAVQAPLPQLCEPQLLCLGQGLRGVEQVAPPLGKQVLADRRLRAREDRVNQSGLLMEIEIAVLVQAE